MKGHFILCGLGRIGSRVLAYLRATGIPIVVIDKRSIEEPLVQECDQAIQGDCRQAQVLCQAGIQHARGILILTSDDLVNLSTTLQAFHLNPKIRIVVRMFNRGLIPRLGPSVQNVTVLSTSALSAPVLAMIARTGEALGEFLVGKNKRLQIAEIPIRARSPLRGLKLVEVLEQHNVFLIGHQPGGQKYSFRWETDDQTQLFSGDHLILCGEPATIANLRACGEPESEPELLWAGPLIRLSRIIYRTWAEIDWPVKLCLSLLVSVVTVSTLLFHWTMRNDSLPDAFYRTISLMATMADMRLRELEPEGWQKIYVSMLRISGAALLAAFTAILTNYLVRAQLKGALEIRRIPEGGHIVVCGLGNVGFRVLEELLAHGEQVVVIERSETNPFISTARKKKAAVIISDARVVDVLKEAHVRTAKALVAATDNELANVEIALLVHEINPAQRVIVRLTDTQLAQTLRDAAGIRLAFSIPDVAAPWFVATLFGDRVHTVFFVQGNLLAVVDLSVGEHDVQLIGQSVQTLAQDYHFQPVSLIAADGTVKDRPRKTTLNPGDRLTIILDLKDLEKLLKNEAVPMVQQSAQANLVSNT